MSKGKKIAELVKKHRKGCVIFLILVVLLIIVAACLLFLSLSLVEVLDGVVRSRAAAYLIVGALYLLLALICYVLRKPLIYDTMANFIGHLFLDGHPKEKEEEA